jgi:hypothetical protein
MYLLSMSPLKNQMVGVARKSTCLRDSDDQRFAHVNSYYPVETLLLLPIFNSSETRGCFKGLFCSQ